MDEHGGTQHPTETSDASHRGATTGVAGAVRERGGDAADAEPSSRPGVPREAEPAGAPEREPEPQAGAEHHLRRAALDEPTPVLGTAQPPRGLSGAIRRAAYSIPETRARHWMLLMLGDRVDVLEHRLGEALAGPAERLGLDEAAVWTRSNPALAAAVAAAGVSLAVVAVRAAARRAA